MTEDNPNGFYAYLKNPQPRASYMRKGRLTKNSGKVITCRRCGEEKSAVGSRRGECRPCHNAAWRITHGLPPISEDVYGNTPRGGNLRDNWTLKKCLSCAEMKKVEDYRVGTTFPTDRLILVSTCRDCRVSKNVLPLRKQDLFYIRELFGNTCGVCKRKTDGKNAHVDHCHDTGIIRGLLCNKCNLALGLLDDDVERLHSLIVYLEERRERVFYSDEEILS